MDKHEPKLAEDPPINCKILLIGDQSVGKSSLLLRFSDKQWVPEDETTIRNHLPTRDTAGQERFRTITPSYYRGAQGIILVYDVSRRKSFEGLPRWYSEIQKYVDSDDVVKILIGNKVDMEFSRQVSTAEGKAFATQMSSMFVEASAKTSVGVQEAFEHAVERILATPTLWEIRKDIGKRLDLEKAEKKGKGGCACYGGVSVGRGLRWIKFVSFVGSAEGGDRIENGI
ncbi:hypothetical protein H0H81_003129 [Sphagnurus paluster]|uniref:Ras-domain-containing protein n=1 Tax=Sphagnurus paluster TaxID=117069 RepID=A0A9P7K2H2_9AGAR|nr:hypothetical protein H0H81_003129 [Sphagnurus paluster]